ncbi:uncharacterized protein BO97DRAFT_10837 [Aspergillus homomorphus CBS 101889]|uniref:Uncharacterized protein n=1 Tax=Aspergillus homomorphus (strain CBS 101889) TaxID=1450537 RepID=A0A395IBK8_ASPHC|nr:hypothetical protein BO97DRAFT_10837 [Aspergillus homomorphus CBS 101889]RAL17612.1 hypothetical protein BO97DRAFT_10837 [Aspergillus homomorphus CBS 101889]
MALQLSRTGNQRQGTEDPTESLTKALASFKEALTAEQRKQFEDSTTVPDAGSVLFFVAQLDAENASKTRRSIAPRLCTFLTATQQFAGAVETFVSSHPETAALIWGGIKTAITVASNVASYFDKVTDMIKEIGLKCPTIEEFGQLYHGHVGLQRSLCEYYAVIVELCSKVIKVSRRTWHNQVFSSILSPFESEFGPYSQRLALSREQVMSQVSLASQQAAQEAKLLLEYESKENSSYRSSALNFFKISVHRQEEARQWQINKTKREKASMKIKIRQNLSPIDHIPPWKRILKQRVQSTAEWLVREDAFLEWNSSPDTSIPWCSGTMGTGKTVLMSNVVSFLHSSRRANDSVAHFFCQADNEPSLSARNILGSICRQLLDSLIERSSHEDLLSIENESERLDSNEIVEFLLSRLIMGRTYYIIVDGLDDCETVQIRQMARALEMIFQGKVGTMKIICAGRPDLEGELFKWVRPQYRIVVDQEKLTLDLDRFIVATLRDCMDEELLVFRDQKIITTIADVLRDGSKGMFLWAGLCIRDLCEKNCDEDILDALNHLPRGLAELFDSKIRQVQQGNDSHQAMDLLQYCGIVKRPLTLEEYREAFSVSVGDKSLNTKRLPNNMNRIVRGCFGLTFVDDEEYTIHYIHHSVKEYLFQRKDKEPARFNAKSITEHFGFLCMIYLNFANFSRQLVKVEKELVDPLLLGTSSIHPDSSYVKKLFWELQSSRKGRALRLLRCCDVAKSSGIVSSFL